MKRVICLIFLTFSFIVHGQQQYSLSGTIFSQNNIPLDTGDVFLLNKKDQSIVKYTFIDNGKFNFGKITTGEYILSVSCLGFQKEEQEIVLNDDMVINVKLRKSTVELDEITIKSTKNDISFDKGNIKVTIENSIFESLPTPTDILSKLPGIQISPNQESISIIGRGSPLLYLDNQKIDIDQLKSLSVDDIKEIEIIDNPSAKYEAEGRSLILITRKQQQKNGYKIQLSETISFKRRFSNYATINTTLKKDKLELRANFNYNQLGFWEGADSKIIVPSRNIISQHDVKAIGPRPQFITGGGFFYQFAKSNYISGRINYRAHTDKFPITTNTVLNVNQTEDFIISETQNDAPRSFLTTNFNFNKKLNPRNNIFFGVQYSNYKRDLKSSIFNNVNQAGFELSQNRNQQYQIGVFASRIDFEKEINKHFKIEIGGSLSIGDAVAFSDFEFINSDQRNTSTYNYDEDMYASYAQLSGTIGHIDYAAGIRSETNIVKGGFRNESDLLVDREQTRLFPKIRLNLPIDSTKSITLNYNTTINRPSYLNASSITTFINPLIEFSRNVNLKPTLTEEVSANFRYKKNELNLSYFNTRNPVFYSANFDSSQDRIITSPQNFEKETGYTVQLRNTFAYKFWNTTNQVNGIYSKIINPSAVVNKTRPYVYYYSNNEFKIASKTTLGINFWGLTKRYQGIFERNAMFILGASFSKTFFKDLDLTINVNDMFRNMNFEDIYTVNDIITEDIFYVNAQEISFSIKYSFGKVKKSSFKNEDVDENLKRIQ